MASVSAIGGCDGVEIGRDAIRNAILFPHADTSAGYEAMAGTMPANFGQTLTAGQLASLVQYLSGLR